MKKFIVLPFLLFSFSFLFGVRPTHQMTFSEQCNRRAQNNLDLARSSQNPANKIVLLNRGKRNILDGKSATHNIRTRRQLNATLFLIKKERKLVLVPRARDRVTRDLFGAAEEDASR